MLIEHASASLSIDLEASRSAQQAWALKPISHRTRPLRKLPRLLIENARALHDALTRKSDRRFADTLSSELMPLAAACQWNCRNAKRILRPRHVRHWGLNPFIGRLSVTTLREPMGIVLIIGTWNYPIYLTAVTAIQAIIAGNAVIIKPAPGCEAVTSRIAGLICECGLDQALLIVLGSDVTAAERAIEAGVDLIAVTASSQTGRKVATKAAEHLVPVIAELSGCDSLIVLDDADLDRVADTIAFGLRLNGGATCMAPRRLLINNETWEQLLPKLPARLAEVPSAAIDQATRSRVNQLIDAAIIGGAIRLDLGGQFAETTTDQSATCRPMIVDHVNPAMELANADIFAPLLSVIRVASPGSKTDDYDSEWVRINNQCQYALTASIFGDSIRAKKIASLLQAGVVTINDAIAPTIEPSIGFGGRKESGYGISRGEEGLRQLTQEKSIAVRLGRFLPHLQKPLASDDTLMQALFQFLYGPSLTKRLAGLRTMIKTGMAKPAIDPKQNKKSGDAKLSVKGDSE